ncbi:MAG: hypothetical protein JWM68_402 [Verrucomicrobiales bacterium]|nr:hypothetical protein [Verrucomicrobiales bacterium]
MEKDVSPISDGRFLAYKPCTPISDDGETVVQRVYRSFRP